MAGVQIFGVQANDALAKAAAAIAEAPDATDSDIAQYVDCMAESLNDKHPGVRIAAARALAHMGDHAEPHAAAMAQKLSASNAFELRKAEAHLKNMGEAGAKALGDSLSDKNEAVRTNAIMTLGQMGATGASVLASHLGDTNSEVRNDVAKVLAQQGEVGADILSKCLTDSDALIRMNAARTLGLMGTSGSKLATTIHAYIPDLLKLLDDDHRNGDVRKSAAEALVRLGLSGGRALATRLADEVLEVRQTVANGLLKMGNVGIDSLIGCLSDSSPGIRRHALTLLVGLGSAGAAALAACLDNVDDAGLRRRAAEGLGQMGAELAAPHIATLASRLGDKDHWVQIAAARSLGQLGTSAGSGDAAGVLLAPCATSLGRQLKARKQLLRHTAAKSLGRAGAEVAMPHAQGLLAQLADKDPHAQARAAETLTEMGKVGQSAAGNWLRDNYEFPRGSRGALCRSGLRPILGRALLNDAYVTKGR